MQISVLIPVMNEVKDLPLLLKDLAVQDSMPTEIIVGDCGSTDGTLELLKQKYPNVRVAHSNIRSPASARNVAAKLATQPLLVFMDSDTRVGPDFLSQLQKEVANHMVDIVSPGVLNDGKSLMGGWHIWLVRRWTKRAHNSGRMVGIGGCIAVRKSVYKQIGGFDESVTKGEDVLFFTKAAGLGMKVLYTDDVQYVTSSRRVRGWRFLPVMIEENRFTVRILKNGRSYSRYK